MKRITKYECKVCGENDECLLIINDSTIRPIKKCPFQDVEADWVELKAVKLNWREK
jgi:hypothetical protein